MGSLLEVGGIVLVAIPARFRRSFCRDPGRCRLGAVVLVVAVTAVAEQAVVVTPPANGDAGAGSAAAVTLDRLRVVVANASADVPLGIAHAAFGDGMAAGDGESFPLGSTRLGGTTFRVFVVGKPSPAVDPASTARFGRALGMLGTGSGWEVVSVEGRALVTFPCEVPP